MKQRCSTARGALYYGTSAAPQEGHPFDNIRLRANELRFAIHHLREMALKGLERDIGTIRPENFFSDAFSSTNGKDRMARGLDMSNRRCILEETVLEGAVDELLSDMLSSTAAWLWALEKKPI